MLRKKILRPGSMDYSNDYGGGHEEQKEYDQEKSTDTYRDDDSKHHSDREFPAYSILRDEHERLRGTIFMIGGYYGDNS